MTVDDLFTSDRQGREAHQTEAARLRALAADATTDTMRKHLEDRARAPRRDKSSLCSLTNCAPLRAASRQSREPSRFRALLDAATASNLRDLAFLLRVRNAWHPCSESVKTRRLSPVYSPLSGVLVRGSYADRRGIRRNCEAAARAENEHPKGRGRNH
jgi:hypothetical protein